MTISRRKLVASGHGASHPKPATTKVGTGARGASKKAETKKRRSRRRSSSSTPATKKRTVENVEGLPAKDKPEYHWQMESGLDQNFLGVGRLLSSLKLRLYEHAEGGLLLVEGDRPHRIRSATELAPFLIDHIRITVTKNGKYHGEKPSDSVLNNMLRSRTFLNNFLRVEEVVTTPILLSGHTPSRPGFNVGGILHLGPTVSAAKGLRQINCFLDVMEWQSNADRTNAVAALLTVPFRRHFVGGKPLVLVTASKSHGGKGTLIDFIRGNTPKAELLYESIDWPMQRSLHEQLQQYPEIGVVNIDNVRFDSSGRGKIIRSGFLESFITSSEVMLSSTRGKPIRIANRFLILLNTNEGFLSIDLLNRSLSIRLNPTGDLPERIEKAKSLLGGDVKHEWLPAHRDDIEAELWGMIERWVRAGKPLDKSVKHPMGPWAQTIGGILAVNGFGDFLGNYSATRAAADPIREAISILAFHAGGTPRRAGELAGIVVDQGLAKTLLPGVDATNAAASQRAIGVMLKPYVGESFTVTTPEERISYRLTKKQGRFEGPHPHYRYTFEEVGREAATEDGHALVLEMTDSINRHPSDFVADLDRYEPETL
jgi:hypothetical protein